MNHTMHRICTRLAGATALALALASTALAQGVWPPVDQPVQLVVTAPVGSIDDAIARMVVERLNGGSLGGRFAITNQYGINGNAGAGTVAAAPADGTRLLLSGSNTLAVNPSLFKELPFDPQKSFQAIGLVADIPNILVVNSRLPVHTLAEFDEYVKTHPGEINFGSNGHGSSTHLAGQLYMNDIDANMVHIPYSSSELAVNNLVSGEIQSMFPLIPGIQSQIKTGKVRALGIMAKTRSSVLPDVPTMAEQGHPRMLSSHWLALLAPKDTPQEIIELANQALNDALRDPSLDQKLAGMGAVALGGTPQNLDDALAASLKKWRGVVAGADIRLQ
ncbi:MAG: tripartite tricarboxylate transporter substrate-binding protein [Burkholderiaceae bacterium]